MIIFRACKICGEYHLNTFKGDCRDNNTRFTIDQIDDLRDRQAARGLKEQIVTEEAIKQ